MKNNIPLWFKVVYVLSVTVAFCAFLPNSTMGKLTVKDSVAVVNKVTYNTVPEKVVSIKVLSTFGGQLTGYGPDCKGCSGITAYGYDVSNGHIYYEDATYGSIRIVAADKKYTFGTVVRITAPNVSSEPFIAIVLDRGGGIKGTHLDLLYSSESETKVVGRQKNVTYEILRNGW